jgi:hypothetical protein
MRKGVCLHRRFCELAHCRDSNWPVVDYGPEPTGATRHVLAIDMLETGVTV